MIAQNAIHKTINTEEYTEEYTEEELISEMRQYRCLLIISLLTLLIVGFIFSNSLKSGEESNTQSAPLVNWVESIFDPYDKIPTSTFNYLVRKAAHITEFSLLGLSLGGLMCCVYRLRGRWHIAAVLFGGLATAVADEFIQSFTGRTSSVTDVLIDFVGVVIGMGIVLLLYWWSSGNEHKTNK